MKSNEYAVPNDTASAKPAPMLDLDEVHDLDSAPYEVLHPHTGKPTGGIIVLAGPEHPARKEVVMEFMRRARAEAALRETQLIEASRRPGRFKAPEAEVRDPAADMKEGIDNLVKATLGWSGIGKDGQLIAYSPKAAEELYADPKYQWLVNQLLVALNSAELFIKA